MRNDCHTCKYRNVDIEKYPCRDCLCKNDMCSHYVPSQKEPKFFQTRHTPHPNYNSLDEKQQDGARRDDATKLRMDLIPPEILTGFSRAATYGVAKYDARNCEKGMAWGRVFGSAMRHLWKFWAGEAYDQESGIHHLDMALWNVGMLATYVKRNIGEDDRGPKVRDINFELQFDPKEVEKK